MPLIDEQGERVRGKENKEAARLALVRVNLVDELSPQPTTSSGEWTGVKICEIYLADLHQSGMLEWAKGVEKWLNDLCGYGGALKVEELQRRHLWAWIQRHKSWNHNTQRNAIASLKAAFNFCCKFDDLESNPVTGYQKPKATPRVTAFTPEEETAILEAADEAHGLFIQACLLTGAFTPTP